MANAYFDYLASISKTKINDEGVEYKGIDKIYTVDLNARTIDTPEMLSVQYDHNAEVILFEMPRYYDGVDLATTTGVVQYINADGNAGIYCIPFFDIVTKEAENKIIFPWYLSGLATKVSGKIKFNFCFYIISGEENPNFAYKLNTQARTGMILHGLDIDEMSDDEEFKKGLAYLDEPDSYKKILQELTNNFQDSATYWVDAE